jgi:hypothetical protein
MSSHRPFTTEDQTLLALLAAQLGRRLHRVHQIHQQREAALALQRAFLGPSPLPDGFAVRCEPAAQPLQVGGDWYDVVSLADGRIGVVVGDCVGRGLGAATVMGQLRSACRALLLKDPRPDKVLAGLDRFADGIPGATCRRRDGGTASAAGAAQDSAERRPAAIGQTEVQAGSDVPAPKDAVLDQDIQRRPHRLAGCGHRRTHPGHGPGRRRRLVQRPIQRQSSRRGVHGQG